MKIAPIAWVMLAGLVMAAPAAAQIGQIGKGLGKTVDKGKEVGKAVKEDFEFTEAEEKQLGADVSAKLRQKYGVVQDAAVHRYVTLVGTVLTQASSRADLRWTFIVLDTDGVNAFAAPGGFIHITRGALALLQNEAELADVLAHEITHVTAKHTIRAIQKGKLVSAPGKAASTVTRSDVLKNAVERLYESIIENKFSRGDEEESDKVGVKLANQAGYAPSGLGTFLARLADRNKALKDRSGMFASHPETTDRVDALNKVIKDDGLKSLALVQARYAKSVSYKPLPVQEVQQVAPPTAEATEAKAEPAKPGGKGVLGLGGLSALGREKSSSSTIASAGSRGVNPDRDAKGGPVKALVVVTVTTAQVTTFRQGIVG